MASGGATDLEEQALPMFEVQKVNLRFSIASDFVAAQVANNVLVLALSTGRLLRIDLDNPDDIDGTGSVLVDASAPLTNGSVRRRAANRLYRH